MDEETKQQIDKLTALFMDAIMEFEDEFGPLSYPMMIGCMNIAAKLLPEKGTEQ